MITKNCTQTTVPEVDNTSESCGDCGYISFECVTLTEAITYIQALPGDSLAEVFTKFFRDYKKKSKRIKDLETALTALTVRVEALEP